MYIKIGEKLPIKIESRTLYHAIGPKNKCKHQDTIDIETYDRCAYIWAGILCLFANPLCTCIPFCMSDLRRVDKYCKQCNQKVSLTRRKATKSHIILSLCVTISLALTILFVVLEATYNK